MASLLFQLLFLAALSLRCFCSAQELVGGGIDCDGNHGICTENVTCIDTYHKLEFYVKNNREIIEKIKDSFFVTGETPSKFVKVIYNFKVSNSIYSTNNSVEFDEDFMNCSDGTSTYIWSESPLYLLGPRTLFSFTFFAISTPEVNVTIDLPCLCYDVYNKLLSRLTYMIKVYGAMEYHNQPLQFISNHYFQAKSAEDRKYFTIVMLMMSITYLPSCMMLLVSFLTINYVYPVVCYYVKHSLQCDYILLKLFSNAHAQKEKMMQAIANEKWKTLQFVSLFLTSIIINIILLMLHISSATEFIVYGDEMLDESSSYSYLPYIHARITYILIGTMFIAGIVSSIWTWNKSDLIATSVSVNIIYVVCYFFPTVLLAFIQDPLLTTFTCVMAIMFVVFIYMYIWSLGSFLVSEIIKKLVPPNFQNLMYPITLVTAAFSIMFFFIMIVSMIMLGSFSDFQVLQNVQMSLLMGLLTFFVLKPVYKYMCRNAKLSNQEGEKMIPNNHDAKVCVVINQTEDNHLTETEQMASQNDENSII